MAPGQFLNHCLDDGGLEQVAPSDLWALCQILLAHLPAPFALRFQTRGIRLGLFIGRGLWQVRCSTS